MTHSLGHGPAGGKPARKRTASRSRQRQQVLTPPGGPVPQPELAEIGDGYGEPGGDLAALHGLIAGRLPPCACDPVKSTREPGRERCGDCGCLLWLAEGDQ